MKHTSFPKVKTEKRPKTYSTAPPMSEDKTAEEKRMDRCIEFAKLYADQQNAALKESLAELIKIADYYHDREVTYTDMPYKNWTAAIDRGKKLIAENREQTPTNKNNV